MHKTMILTIDDRGVATLTLNRPGKHDALSRLMISEISNALETLDPNDDVHELILRGQKRAFVRSVI